MFPVFSFVEPDSNTLSTLHKCNLHTRVGLLRSHWYRSVARWWKGEEFTEKTNVELEDEEFAAVDVEPRGSEPNKQSNDPPPEFTGTNPSEFKSYRKKEKLWLLFTRTPARVLSRLATNDGANVILDILAEAFQGEHDTELFDALKGTFHGPGKKKGERHRDYALREQSNVRELAKQGVRLPDQVQGFLLPRRAKTSELKPSLPSSHWRATACRSAM